ncbi:uncharacterized protein LOC122385999 [Amphibalanus amphitrite]|uniref:uncharacterized protein LOC122385999 n=1 Tax=Amphibalanus amphitrite TaxID=1232801 RepID=UPI001C91596C|nr:uncharacterized protein LOC122385999 [Amphibalanus amphitrite]
MDVASRWRAVRLEGLCYQCLGPHMVRVCTSSTCPRCGEAHHSSLHDAGGSAAPVRPPAAPVRPPAAPVRPPAAPVRLPAAPVRPPAAPARQGFARQSPAAPHPPRAVDRSMHAVTCTAPAAAAAWSPGWPDHLTFQDSQTPAWTERAPVEQPSGGEVTGHTSAVGPSVQSPSAAAVQPPCQATSPGQGKHLYNVNAQSSCFVQTVLVEVSGPGGVCQVRALIDGGSDSSFIRSSLAEKLGLETEEQGVFACVGFMERTEEARVYDRVSVKLTGRQGGEATLSFWKTDRLCVPVGTYSLPENLSLPPSVVLADDYREGPVDLLIGCDQIYQVVMWDQVEVGPGLRLIETVFGHVLHGQAQNQQTEQRRVYRCQLADVERMWSLDAVGISAKETADEVPPEPTWNPEEQRYEMGLLWKSDSRPASNLTSTELRTRRLVSKMSTDELDRYDRHISELIVNGVVEDAPLTDDPDDAFFLPHRGVVRGDKLRVVFDGSAPDATGWSLNEYLSPGENLLSRLPSVLLNFRTNAVGCQADIRAAFHQIVLKEEDRRYVQFLWGDRHLRFQRVPFGVSCSPYMLLRTVCCHVRQCLVSQPELMQKVQGALYMDDLCPTFGTREEAAAGMKEVSSVFSKARMELHKTRTTGDVSSEDSKVLGLAWNTETDRLAVTVPEMLCPRTWGELLSAVAKPFDPLGLLTPWLVRGKALFQRTWSVELTWDEPLPDALQAEVAAWWQDSAGSTVSFPRAAMIGETSLGTQYHVFCDASKTAYCATVYVSQGGESQLLICKGRLAPINPSLTVPRLELMAALTGARLMAFVTESLCLSAPSVTYWTDSTDVLCWIKSDKLFRVFVQNRVTAIRELTDPDRWRFVRGLENPADLGTRGITLSQLAVSAKWWNGPPFLVTSDLPPQPDPVETVSPEADVEERRVAPVTRSHPVMQNVPSVETADDAFQATDFSDLGAAVNRIAWLKRFVHNARSPETERQSGPLSPEERREALVYWIREAQRRAFPEELRAGTRVTLALLSGEYFIRRRTVRRVLGTCFRCRRYRGLPYRAADGRLPAFRSEVSRPFSKVGIDYFGPLYVDRDTKVWALLITCASSRAVHLELVRSQSAADLTLALRRFMALRGTPSLIVSDNARTFRALVSHVPRSVKWRFIPEAAPWWGGFWERLVGVTKSALKITLHQCHLSYDELAVTLYELAFHLNLRPLTPSDGDDLLTPAHLLFGVTTISGVVCPSLDSDSHVGRTWRNRRRVSDCLVRRWTTEYLETLRGWAASPRGRPTRLPAVGQVVLLQGEGRRGTWPLARVVSLIPGSSI